MVDNASQATWCWHADDEAATDALGAAVAQALPRPAVVALHGALGAGKTRLVRAIAMGLSIDSDRVTSPTFVLLHEYWGETPLFHFDAYRLAGEEEFWQLGAEEYLDGALGGVTAIEWAERVAGCLPPERFEIRIEVSGETRRKFTFAAHGEGYLQALGRLKELLIADA